MDGVMEWWSGGVVEWWSDRVVERWNLTFQFCCQR